MEEGNLHASFEDALVVPSEDEIVLNQTSSRNSTTFKYINSEEHKELLMWKKGKYLSILQKACLISTLSEFPEDKEMIKSQIENYIQPFFASSRRWERLGLCISIFDFQLMIVSRFFKSTKTRTKLKSPTVPIFFRMIKSNIYEKFIRNAELLLSEESNQRRLRLFL